MPISRFLVIVPALVFAAGLFALSPSHVHAGDNMTHVMHVTKTPTCGCCTAWVDLAKAEGFDVEVTDTEDYAAMKQQAGVPAPMQSCHTTRIGGYIVEGHVPFAAVRKLLTEKPKITGISVPGMPMGSPGMGDDPKARFDVLAFGGEAKPNNVFYEAGIGSEAPGFLDGIFGK